ncbi:hypothetical protein [Tepidimicrobium xylanilyticum]
MMFFNESSYLVQLYVINVRKKAITRESVPALFNLQEMVYQVLDAQ